jgi:UDP-N-acetyl-D-glucosamine dehydrogenase
MSVSTDFKSPLAESLLRRIATRTARTGVIGLGYVGLPLAAEFGRAGFNVTGIDVDLRRCEQINQGDSPIPDVPSAEVAALVRDGRLRATTDLNDIGQLDTVNICVPTPLRKTKDPDLSYLVSAAEAVGDHLHPGMLVILESTTYPGTTEEVVRSILERTGLKAGIDFFLAFSPERVDPGNAKWNTRNVPKVVGGLTPDCSALASALDQASIERVVQVSSPRAAEMVKLLENTFRAINIGLVNEMALMCDRIGIDVWEVIDAAATKPFGFMPFYPGPGLGGHCIPIDPFYLSWKVREVGFEARFIDLAGHVNAAMPHHVVDKINDALNSKGKAINNSEIFVVGVSYKPDIDDIRESPALDVMSLLVARGARVAYHDPFVPRIDAGRWAGGLHLENSEFNSKILAEADCVVILTNHSALDYAEIMSAAKIVVDTRNAIKASSSKLFRLGAPNPTVRDPS